mgnify:FL=1
MIRFNELKIEDNYIIIDVQIEEEKYFKDMYIDSIVIDTQDTFIANGPSSKAIYTKTFNTDTDIKKEEIIYTQGTDKYNRVRIHINGKNLNVDIHKTMFFVYVIAGGTPAADTPCRWDENKALHTLVDTQVLYNNMIQYVKELNKDCSTPDNFINAILQFNAIDLALKTNQYPLAIELWKRFYSDIESNVVLPNCGCNGRL